MRKVNVYYGDVYAGQLVELSRGSYEFTYDDAFRADGSTPPVSVHLPKSQKVYHSERIFPVFTPTCCLREPTVGHCAGRGELTKKISSVCWR